MTIDWENEAAAAADRVAIARAEARAAEGLEAAAQARANGPAAQRYEGESEFWELRARVHALQRRRLSEEAEAEELVELYSRRHMYPS